MLRSALCFLALCLMATGAPADAERAVPIGVENVEEADFELGGAFMRDVAGSPTLIFTAKAGERALPTLAVVLAHYRDGRALGANAFRFSTGLPAKGEDLYLEALSLPDFEAGDRLLLAPPEYFPVPPGPFGDTPRDDCDAWCDFCATLATGICGEGGINEYSCECSPNRKVCNFICAE